MYINCFLSSFLVPTVRPERNTDSADLLVVMQVFNTIIQRNIKNVVIIAGDGDFGELLRKTFKKKSLNIMLAYPKGGNKFMTDEPPTAWIWTDIESPDDPALMVNGGPPLFKNRGRNV